MEKRCPTVIFAFASILGSSANPRHVFAESDAEMMRQVAIKISKRVESGMKRPVSVPNVPRKFSRFAFRRLKDVRRPGI